MASKRRNMFHKNKTQETTEEGMDTGGTVVGDPPEVYVPRTPRRRNRRSWQAGDQNDRGGNNAKRRTLFFSAGRRLPVSPDSDLSDISPLSKTSGSEGDQLSDTGRPTALPWSPNRTPLKCISPLKNNFDQLLIGKSSPSTPHVSPSPFSSPLADRRRSIQASRPGRSPRLKGISPLGPDRGVIEPVKFYGNKEETPLNGVQLLRKIRASLPSSLGSVRARLFLDDHPRDRKRARSGGAAAGPAYAVRRPPSKRQKRHHHSSGAVIKERPRLLLDHETAGRRFSDPPKRKTTPEGPKLPAKSPKSEFGGLKKRVCNWEVFSFSRPPRVRPREDEEGAGTFGPRKFFKTVVDKTPKRPCDDTTEGVLTPPPTVRKSRKLLSKSDWFDGFTQLDDLPETDSDVGGERSQEDDDSSKRIVEEIREDVLEMMVEDNGDEEVRNEVEELLKSWDDGSEEEGATGGDAAPDTQEDGPTRVNDVYSKKTEMAKPAEKETLIEFGDFSQKSSVPFSMPPAPENKKSDDVGSKFFPIFSTSLSLAMSPNGKKKQLDKKSKLGWGEDQLQIDAGQNGLREVQCATCGLLYAAGNPEDEQQHEAYHNKYAELRYTPSSNFWLRIEPPPSELGIVVGETFVVPIGNRTWAWFNALTTELQELSGL
ncbi:hypothetical protein AAG570_007291 [Ranatra chinensis]|uniref:N-acetyltransferase ESCO zinc-finger domain-containing protein n=1 Tax=Ranatra chinensis TaxID=642074 RepID=A0ABD0XXB9_9HEMI